VVRIRGVHAWFVRAGGDRVDADLFGFCWSLARRGSAAF